MPVLTLAQSEQLVVRTLTRCKTAEQNARSVARALVMAEAEGLKGHGLSRVPVYAAQAKIGKVDGFATPAMTRPRMASPIRRWPSPLRSFRRSHVHKASASPQSAARIIAAPPVIRSSGWRRRALSR
jgi:hypothetical protein